MYIPTHWSRTSGIARRPDGREIPVSVWGWGEDATAAQSKAAQRLRKMTERLSRGEPFPEKYTYDHRPVREEILETIGSDPGKHEAMVTRNRHGVQVLNTAELLFLDIDLVPPNCFQRLMAKLGLAKDRSEAAVLERLREALQQHGRATFRIYRTAGGLRALAVDRQYKPSSRETHELMEATGTDPAFMRMCEVQDSFRARLSPKPWRCGCQSPGIDFPRNDPQERAAFATWIKQYERASAAYATCRFLETVGNGRPADFARTSIELHDRLTRCEEDLPLA